MLKKIKLGLVALLLPLIALAGTYPSPTFQNVTINGALTVSGGNSIGLGALTQQAANTVLANATGSTANVTAFAMPSCSTSASALNWTTNTGFTCNTSVNAAQLGGATFAAPGPIGSTTAGTGTFTTLVAAGVTQLSNTSSGSSVLKLTGNGATTPNKFLGVLNGNYNIQNSAQNTNILSLTDAGTLSVTGAVNPSTTGGILGTTAGDNANAGSVGEYITANASSVSVSNGTAANVTSISLTAGDWDVTGQVVAVPAASTVLTQFGAGVNTTSATMPTAISGFGVSILTGTLGTNTNPVVGIMPTRINVTTTTTVFLVTQVIFSTSTCTVNGIIRARRVR